MNAQHVARSGVCTVLMLVLGGCMVGPDFVRPEPPETARYLPGEPLEGAIPVKDQAQYFDAGADLMAGWWRLFKSPKLNALVTEGINNNQSLRAAQAALRQSQHNLLAGYGVFFPQADVGGSAVRQRFSSARFVGAGPVQHSTCSRCRRQSPMRSMYSAASGAPWRVSGRKGIFSAIRYWPLTSR